jgi:hypothetical protein
MSPNPLYYPFIGAFVATLAVVVLEVDKNAIFYIIFTGLLLGVAAHLLWIE